MFHYTKIDFMPKGLDTHPFYVFSWLITTGAAIGPFWYIPMASLLYLFSPLAIRLSNYRFFKYWLIILLFFSLFIHRPYNNNNPLHQFFLFFPIFLLGITVSKHREAVLIWIKGKRIVLIFAALALSVLQGLLHSIPIYQKKMFEFQGVDFNTLQKINFIFVFYSILNEFEKKDIQLLKIIAKYSFPLYFLHSIMVVIIKKTFCQYDYCGNFFVMCFFSASLLILSICIAKIVKALLGDKSFYFIGI
jgi:peptidoglycan/LPS O-acetylase OafA/YrhL